MASFQELLQPIPGPNPSGEPLRTTPAYDALKEARKEEEDLPQGEWKRERKVADYLLVVRLATDALKTKTKDLEIAAWLTEAWLHREAFAGLQSGFALCIGLLTNFWDTLYPPVEEGDLEYRAMPLSWLGSNLEDRVRKTPLTQAGYGWYAHKESRAVGYEDQAKDAAQKKAREKILNEGKLAPEVFDKSFAETPKAFYAALEKDLDASLKELAKLDELCQEKFGDDSPSFGRLLTALQEVRHVAHSMLQKKRDAEPDPEPEPAEEASAALVPPTGEAADRSKAETRETNVMPATVSVAVPINGAPSLPLLISSEPSSRRELVEAAAAVASALRQREPFNPAPFLMMRGLRWGDLRAAAVLSDPLMLEAPPTEVRQHIKKLALQEKWKELLEAAEAVMALPCSRAWLDLQRFVVEACVALGEEYHPIALAIRSELRALLRDVPQLWQATLMDDTPAANQETRMWLRQILAEPAPNGAGGPPEPEPAPEEQITIRWQKKFVDSSVLAKEALRGGQPEKALEIMQGEINRQRSARGRFQRRLQFVELCVAAGKEAIAQPILDDLLALIDTHKLEEWEDKTAMAAALVTVMRASKKIQSDAKEKQKLFDRICRLDPVQALNC